MKNFWIQVVALVIVIIVSVILTFSSDALSRLGLAPAVNNQGAVSQVKIGSTLINVELADTPEKRTAGLSGRDKLDSNSGMLFTFQTPAKYSFWMKGMKFPLDFIWIKDNKVVDILQNVPNPSPNQSVEELPVYEPVTTIDKVLEVNAGFSASHDIKIGDTVNLING